MCALVWLAVEAAGLPRTAFYGGRKLAEKFVRLAALEREGPIDVFVIGPSHVDQGFDARRFGEVTGLRTFDLGVMGTDMYFQSVLVRDLVLRGDARAPKAVLWALRDETLTKSNINNQYLGCAALSYAHGPLGDLALALGQYLPQFHRRRILEWFQELVIATRGKSTVAQTTSDAAAREVWLEPLDAYGRTELSSLTRKRQAPSPRTHEEADEREEGEDEPAGTASFLAKDYSVDVATAQAHVAETLRLLRARGIQVWLFFTPYYQEVFGRGSKHARLLLTGQNEAYYAWVRGLARELDLPLVDLRYCAEISSEPRYFYDTRHLNNPGSTPFAQLMGELFTGKRPIPELWRGAPAPAQFQAIFGRVERERVPRLALGEPQRLDALHGERRDGVLLDAYASFRIERAGRYRVSLSRAGDPPSSPDLYARLGDGHYERWTPPAGARRAVVLETALAPGEHVLELHSANAKRAIEWDEMLVELLGP